jgi:hypothetical protein
MDPKVVLGTLLGIAVVVSGAWWLSAQRHEAATTAEREARVAAEERLRAAEARVVAERGGTGAPDPILEGAPGAEARFEEMKRENARLEAAVKELQAELDRRPPAPERDPSAFRFGLGEKTPVFDQAEWGTLGGHLVELAKSLAGLRKEIDENGQPGPGTIAAIQKHNIPLATLAIGLAAEVGGAGPNGAYTHPAVIANLLRAALLQAGDPLTADQESALRTLGEAWVRDEARRGASGETLALASIVADVEARRRFLDAAKGVLTPAQRALLFPAETEDRVGLDLFSPALIYQLRQHVTATDRETLEGDLLKNLVRVAGVSEENADAHRWIAERWVGDLSRALVPTGQRSPDLLFPHLDLVHAHAVAQVAATRRFLDTGGLTEAQAEALRENSMLLSPYLLAAE